MDALIKKKRVRGWPNDNIRSVKKRLAKVLAQVEQGKIEVSRARLLVQGAAVLVNAVKIERELAIEERLNEIERRIGSPAEMK
jgi:tetrahydromethanopterin S-methyltransferase subunit G